MKPGDKVVCVDDSPCVVCGRATNIKKGEVYVIRGIDMAAISNRMIVFLVGNTWACHESIFGELGFLAKRFRLLDELRQESRDRQQQAQPA